MGVTKIISGIGLLLKKLLPNIFIGIKFWVVGIVAGVLIWIALLLSSFLNFLGMFGKVLFGLIILIALPFYLWMLGVLSRIVLRAS